jgi:peptidoglycan/LPS O-acetylase OafA/YrhL
MDTRNANFIAPPGKTRHVHGLDTLRAICTFWVVIVHSSHGHLPFPFFGNHLMRTVLYLFGAFFNGQAAVILFFVISGFCIHWPYAMGKRFVATEFLNQRLLRIGLPLIGALGFGWLVDIQRGSMHVPIDPFGDPLGVPIWSLWCEMIYYVCYPLINRLISRFGMQTLFVASILPSILVFFTTHQWNEKFFFHSGGICFWRTAVMGLPFWLGGGRLAENLRAMYRSEHILQIPHYTIWLYRVGIYFAQGVSSFLAQRFSIGIPLTLLLLMPLFFRWLEMEIRYFSTRPESGILERIGIFSYSIYLIHISIYKILQPLNEMPWPLAFRWFLSLGLILAGSWCFYRCVELPSHRLAKAAGGWLKRRAETGTFTQVPELASID